MNSDYNRCLSSTSNEEVNHGTCLRVSYKPEILPSGRNRTPEANLCFHDLTSVCTCRSNVIRIDPENAIHDELLNHIINGHVILNCRCFKFSICLLCILKDDELIVVVHDCKCESEEWGRISPP